MATTITHLDAVSAEEAVDELTALLIDAVAAGASLGFQHPLVPDEAQAYWQTVVADLAAQRLWLAVAVTDHRALVGSVQMRFPPLPNGRHRAEVEKLLVLRSHRRQGIGDSLLAFAETAAIADGRTLLFLEVRDGSGAERLYARRGWTKVGVIPGHARYPRGGFAGTAIWYTTLPQP